MSTETDTPRITIASFEVRDNKVYLRADTTERVQLNFELDPMALAIMSLTMGSALQWAKATMEAQTGPAPKPPSAPDTPEGLEG